MEGAAHLVSAIASALWPILTFITVLVFRKQLVSLTKRLRKGKVSGVEVELADDLDLADRKLEEARASLPALPALVPESRLLLPGSRPVDEANAAGSAEEVVARADESTPTLALIAVAGKIERELRQIMFSQGPAGNRLVYSMANATKILRSRGLLADPAAEALDAFRRVRNAVVHGQNEPAEHEILRALDLGAGVLDYLRSIPRQISTVRWAAVPLFSDSQGSQVLGDVSGVILEMRDSGTDRSIIGIFPTTKRDYKAGDEVAWEWNSLRQWDRTWYRDPADDTVKVAWDGSMEFVGRVIQRN